MNFTGIDFSTMPDNSSAYIAFDIDDGFRLLTEVLDGPIRYLSDGAAVSLGNCYMQGSVLTALTANSFSSLSSRNRPLIKVGSSWAVMTQFLDNNNIVLDRTLDSGRLCTISGSTVTTTNNYSVNTPITFRTVGVLPTNITAGQVYYVLTATTSSFTFSATPGGSVITTSGGSGLHSVYRVFSALTPSYVPDNVKDTIIATVLRSGTTYNIEPYYSVNNESNVTITTISALPASGDYEGQIVLYNNILYTWNGVSWATGATGSNGLNNGIAYLYQRSATAPVTAPAGNFTYTFATGVLSGGTLNGYSFTIPTSNGNPLWVVAASASSSAATDTILGTEFSAPVALASDGLAGLNSATVYLYQRAATEPADPTGNVTYTFSTGVASNLSSGWTQTLPTSGTNPIWVITATAASTTATDDITPSEWAPAAILAQNGAAGTNGTRTAILDLYQWASAVPTLFPSGSSTYTWATGQFTAPATLNGWSLTPGSSSPGQVLYIARQVFSDTLTSATSSVSWSTSSAINLSVAGNNGTRVGYLEVYRWSAAAPTSFPSGTSTYTWATGAFTAPSTPNGWSLTPGAAVLGQTLWGISVYVANTNTSATDNVTWNSSTVYPVGYAGTNGTNGGTGPTGPTGAQARIAYAIGTSNFAFSGTQSVSRSGDALPASGNWGLTATWSATPTNPTSNGTSLYQVTGLFDGTNTIWSGYPYLSALKVGELSAITATIGILRTATTGARTEIKDNLIEIYDATRLRVRLGIWT